MGPFKKTVKGISQIIDAVAGWCLVAAVTLIIGNVILRTVFSRPFMGTYEFVGYIVSVVIAFSLAHCALMEGHISVGFMFERFPRKVKMIADVSLKTISFLFIGLMAWSTAAYGSSIAKSGEVSSTTQIPFYPFVFLVSFGIMALSLVLLFHLVQAIKGDAER